tara:strand:+ start:885 stop:1310 length:426 start_codon:yes stop_codon:yes gene_type:complete
MTKKYFLKTLLPLSVLILIIMGSGLFYVGIAPSYETIFLSLILSLSLTAAYLFLFIGIVHDSPTLSIINAISNSGEKGFPKKGMSLFVAANPFVTSRLLALENSEILIEKSGKFSYNAKFNLILQISDYYFRLCKIDPSKG